MQWALWENEKKTQFYICCLVWPGANGCLLIQSESIRRYIIIIYIDDDMMSHPVFFNQIIIVCINRRRE